MQNKNFTAETWAKRPAANLVKLKNNYATHSLTTQPRYGETRSVPTILEEMFQHWLTTIKEKTHE